MNNVKISRNSFLKLMGVGSMATALVACGASSSSSSVAAAPVASSAADTTTTAAAALTGKVATGGSTSMEKVMSALMEGFAAENPDVDVTYDPTGSGAGVTGAVDGTLDIGLASRGLHDDEAGVSATTVALDGIAIVVNTANTVADLTVEQIADIFTGKTTNWKDLGGADGEIVVIGREAGSGTRDGFESIVDVKDTCVYAQELTATGAVITAVAGNEAAIGYASLSALDGSVNAVTVGGITCSEDTVLDGSYTIQRPFNFVTNDANTQSDAVKAFITYATSADAAELIRSAGAVPMV